MTDTICLACGWEGDSRDLIPKHKINMECCPVCFSWNVKDSDEETDEDRKPDIWSRADEAYESAREILREDEFYSKISA